MSTIPIPPANTPYLDPVTGGIAEVWRRYFLDLENSIPPDVPPVDAQYWVSTSNGTLTAERNLGALSSGFVKITSTLGIATPSTVSSITEANLSLSDVTTDDVTSTRHGFAPKSPGTATRFLNGAATPEYAQVQDTDLDLSNTVANNVSSSMHGFAPKSGADATTFLNGAATPAYAAVKDSDLSTSNITTNNVTSAKHGFAPITPADATQFLNGAATAAYAQVKDSDLSVSDVTTNNASNTAHGFLPKTAGDATKFLNGANTPAFALVKDTDLSTSDNTTNDVTTAKHGFTPKAPNDTTKFLRGDATWAVAPTAKVRMTFFWMVLNCAANATTAGQLLLPTNTTAFSINAILQVIKTHTSGSIVGGGIVSSAAVTAQSIVLKANINGSTNSTAIATLDTTNTRSMTGTIASGSITFTSGQTIGADFVAPTGYTPTGNDYTAWLVVEFDS